MGTTPKLNLPYPETNVAPTVPLHMRQLAEAVEEKLFYATGEGTVNFNNTQAVTVSINHNLGVMPSYADAIIVDGTARAVFTGQITVINSTQITFLFTYRLAANVTFTSPFRWIAFR